ncbi:MAG: hypothetical protein ACREI3_09695, partial [Nitrospirales bacterium]
MTPARDVLTRTDPEAQQRKCLRVKEALTRAGLLDRSSADGRPTDAREPEHQDGAVTSRWRLAPRPFLLSAAEASFFQALGPVLLAFYRAWNRLYLDSVRGSQPAWVHAYLDQGKPESLLAYSRMKRFRDLLPAVLRPDMLPTEATGEGYVITELDSVPGGIGLTGALAQAYASLGFDTASAETDEFWEILGGRDGMVQGFARMVHAQLAQQAGRRDGCVGIVVSDESKDYRPEMAWLADRLKEEGLEAWCVDPRDVRFTEDGLSVTRESGARPMALLYRFFELFDLMNIPKAELIMYAAKKGRVTVTPPFKPALEEKSAFGLLHHPVLRGFWERELGEEAFGLLHRVMPRTWILDPRPLPPTAVIPDLTAGGRPVTDWRALADTTQKDRHYVVKPSGFSPLAWGSRGVSVGHDLSQAAWSEALDHALSSFPTTPYVLQAFHKSQAFDLVYYDEARAEMLPMPGRARLSPYYFVVGDQVELGGILATVCPLDKKLIHGMRDAIMLPCAVETSGAHRE